MVSSALQSEPVYTSISKVVSFPTAQRKQILYTSVLDMTTLVQGNDVDQSEVNIRHSTVKLSEVFKTEYRLDADFNIKTKLGDDELKQLLNSDFKTQPLCGENGFCKVVFSPDRFKRVFVENDRQGVPFLSSSEINSLKPEAEQYLSLKNAPDLEKLITKKWDILISRSGVIGNIGLASESFLGQAFSEDVIRIRSEDPDTAGFVAAFLRSRYGRSQLNQVTYASTVGQIDLKYLEKVLIPDLPPIRQIAIGRLMCKAGELRDEANQLLDQADHILHERLNLPYLKDIAPIAQASVIAKIKASELMGRFEGSFHNPVARTAEKQLQNLPVEMTVVGDPRVTKEVRAITRFRKRTYVEKGGIPLLSSKQLFQIDPIDVKRLAKGAHTKDLPEIQLQENMLAVTCSGTIGRVQIIPAYMASWTANQHANRLLASDGMNAGYLYAWLASDYGYSLITRHSYGSVILEFDRFMLASVPIPLPEASIRDEIGNLVLRANQLRDEAWRSEQQAITKLENFIAGKYTPENSDQGAATVSLANFAYDPDAIPIWELAAQLSATVPNEEWAKLPTDLARNFDHYQ